MSTSAIRRCGLAAMIGGIVGVLYFPFQALAYFATSHGMGELEAPWVAAWASVARPILDPFLTFTDPDTVYMTYGKLLIVIVAGFLAGLIGLHASQAGRGGRMELWGFRSALPGLVLLNLGAIGAFWIGELGDAILNLTFFALMVPGFLVTMIGMPFFGIGTLRGNVAPRLGAWLLTVGGFPGIILLSILIGHNSGAILLLDFAWIVIGYALWRGRSVEALHGRPVAV
jgi:hypothetical protein